MLEVLGPVNVQCMLLTFGGTMVGLSSLINGPTMYTVLRFLIGCAGATFVTNQFWCSLMFAPNVVGTANATAAGWGNLGGGVTQIFIMWALVIPMRSMGLNDDLSWRLAMLVPSVLFFTVAFVVKTCCWDVPNQRRLDISTYKGSKKPSFMDYGDCLKDPRVVIMVAQYGACFGTELAMNNQLATHFRVYFQMPAGEASLLAGCFGLMNLFARSLGGISSDTMFAKFGFRGRLWAHFLSLFFEGVFLFLFGCVSNEYEWYHALSALVCFSLFVQMAEGTSYGIVPFMKKEQLAMVSALVGAGGNAGAVFAGFAFYKQDWEDTLTPFKLHAGFVISMALLSPLFYWPEYGSMFTAPAVDASKDNKSVASNEQPLTIMSGDTSPTSGKSQVPLAPETARV
jgi:NNP family nitrate/nitrite transporter-like MFS transporter